MATNERPQYRVLRPSEISAKSRGGGVRTIPLVTRNVGATSFINGITIFDPGAAVPMHSHNCDESIVILEGNAIAEIDGVEHAVATNDVTFLPANIPHRFRNASSTAVMRMLWTYARVDATRTLIETGATHTIDEEHGERPHPNPLNELRAHPADDAAGPSNHEEYAALRCAIRLPREI